VLVYDEDDLARPVPAAGAAPPEPAPDVAPIPPSMERFRGCRWRKAPENGSPECCGHRDVLPLTGANGFDPGAWCPECGFYKPRRAPRRRDDYAPRY